MIDIERYKGTQTLLGIALDNYGRVRYAGDEWISSHAHANYELCLVTQGTVIYGVEGRSHIMSPGDLCITRPGELHDMSPADNRSFELTFINIRQLELEELRSSLYSPGIRVVTNCWDLVPLFDDLFNESRKCFYCAAMAVHVIAIRLLIDIVRRLKSSDKNELASPYSFETNKAMEYMGQFPRYSTTLGEVSRHAGRSVSWLCDSFKRETGMTVRTYLRMVIMERAKRLLEEGDETVTEIADRLGFPNTACFSSFFRSHEGCPPTFYRRQAIR